MLGYWRASALRLEFWIQFQGQPEKHGSSRKTAPTLQEWMHPRIRLTADSLRDDALGITDEFGFELSFHAGSVAAMPDDVVQDLIAHELAHVKQSAYGIRLELDLLHEEDGTVTVVRDCYDSSGAYWGGSTDIESDADATMDDWGFDSQSIDRWSLAAGRVKTLEFRSEADRRNYIERCGRLRWS